MGLGEFMQTSVDLEFEKPTIDIKDFETLFTLCLYDDAFSCNLVPVKFYVEDGELRLRCETFDSKRVYTQHVEYQAQCLTKLFRSNRVFLTPTDNYLYEDDEIIPRWIYNSETIEVDDEDGWKTVKDAIWNENLLTSKCVVEAIESGRKLLNNSRVAKTFERFKEALESLKETTS